MNIETMANEILENVGRKHAAKKQTVYVCPGKGRKPCPECGNYVGVRTLLCECGHEFVKGQSTSSSTADKNSAYEEPISDEDRRYALAVGLANGCTMVYAGAGPCPASLGSSNPEDILAIKQFCEDIVSAGVPHKKLYMQSAIKHWLANEVDCNTEAYLEMVDIVDDWYNEKVASTMGMEV